MAPDICLCIWSGEKAWLVFRASLLGCSCLLLASCSEAGSPKESLSKLYLSSEALHFSCRDFVSASFQSQADSAGEHTLAFEITAESADKLERFSARNIDTSLIHILLDEVLSDRLIFKQTVLGTKSDLYSDKRPVLRQFANKIKEQDCARDEFVMSYSKRTAMFDLGSQQPRSDSSGEGYELILETDQLDAINNAASRDDAQTWLLVEGRKLIDTGSQISATEDTLRLLP